MMVKEMTDLHKECPADSGLLGAASDWISINLGRTCTKIGSGATPRGGGGVYLATGPYALIRSQNILNDGFHHEGLVYIGEQHASELVNAEVLDGDVLLNITGDSVARACQVNPQVLPARVNQHVAIITSVPQSQAQASASCGRARSGGEWVVKRSSRGRRSKTLS